MPKKKTKKKKVINKKTIKKSKKAVKKSKKKEKQISRISKAKKKTGKKKKIASKGPAKPKGQLIGKITHYFPHVQAAVVVLSRPLKIGDLILVKGHTTQFEQTVTSMQIDHAPISEAKKGDEIGMQVTQRVREHDEVYKPS